MRRGTRNHKAGSFETLRGAGQEGDPARTRNAQRAPSHSQIRPYKPPGPLAHSLLRSAARSLSLARSRSLSLALAHSRSRSRSHLRSLSRSLADMRNARRLSLARSLPRSPARSFALVCSRFLSLPLARSHSAARREVDAVLVREAKDFCLVVMETKAVPMYHANRHVWVDRLAERALGAGQLTGAAGVTAGVRTPVTLVVGAEKATLTRRTLSRSAPVGDSHVGCGCHPHPAAHISHTADATPPPGHAATFPPPAGSPRRCCGGRE